MIEIEKNTCQVQCLRVDRGQQYYEDAYQAMFLDGSLDIGKFLPEVSCEDAAIKYRDMKSLKETRPVGKWLTAPTCWELERFEKAVEQLKEIKKSPRIDTFKRDFLEDFKLPNPDYYAAKRDSMGGDAQNESPPYPYRWSGKWWNRHLQILWGWESNARSTGDEPPSVSPEVALEKLRKRELPPTDPQRQKKYAVLTTAVVLIIVPLAALTYYWLSDQTAPRVAWDKPRLKSARSVEIGFTEPIRLPSNLSGSDQFQLSGSGPRKLEDAEVDDQNIVRLRFSPPLDDQQKLKVVLDGVMDLNGNRMPEVKLPSVQYLDTEAPRIISMRELSGSGLRATLSEAVNVEDGIAMVRKNGVEGRVQPVGGQPTKRLLIQNIVQKLDYGESYQLEFVGVSDTSKNSNELRSYTYHPKDHLPPEIEGVSFNDDGIHCIIEFNEQLEPSSVSKRAFSFEGGKPEIYDATLQGGRKVRLTTDFVRSFHSDDTVRLRIGPSHLPVDEAGNKLQSDDGKEIDVGIRNVSEMQPVNFDVKDYDYYRSEEVVVFDELRIEQRNKGTIPPLALRGIRIQYANGVDLSIPLNGESSVSGAASEGLTINPRSMKCANKGDDSSYILKWPTTVEGAEWARVLIETVSHGQWSYRKGGAEMQAPKKIEAFRINEERERR